ncbi:MAG: hypothetical protein A2Y10_09830 [Planctomycetes bacterium GWF2_41_51]|nr:MAG: hypothetical protein A2Y10_09830 [Planctomycetes bacterium GWF2_41_51]
MSGKIVFAILFAIFISSNCAVGATITWDAGGADHLFDTAANWNPNTVPEGGDSGDDALIPVTSYDPLVDSSVSDIHFQKLCIGSGSAPGTASVNVTGGSLNPCRLYVGYSGDCSGFLYITGGTISVSKNIVVGGNGYGTLTISGGTLKWRTDNGYQLYVGDEGNVNINGGILEGGDLFMVSGGHLNITSSGKLILYGDGTTIIQNYIDAGYITAYGGDGTVMYDYHNTNAGKTTVWAASGMLTKAHNPSPINDNGWMPRDGFNLSWRAGGNDAALHDVYFGTSYSSVNSATTASAEYKGNQTTVTYDPVYLTVDTDYYWRIDEKDNGGYTVKGDVWHFRTYSTGIIETTDPCSSRTVWQITDSDLNNNIHSYYDHSPWNPATYEIIYTSTRNWYEDGNELMRAENASEIWVMDPESYTHRRIKENAHFNLHVGAFPMWSPDGQKILYGDVDEGNMFYICDMNSMDITTVYGMAGREWSPDGKYISGYNQAVNEVFVYDVVNDVTTSILTFEDLKYANSQLAPALYQSIHGLSHTKWSPDGARLTLISLITYDGQERYFLHTFMPDGSFPLDISPSVNFHHHTWTPDSQKIVFGSGGNDPSWAKQYIMDSDGSDVTLLTSGVAGHISLNPDGSKAVAERDYIAQYFTNISTGTNTVFTTLGSQILGLVQPHPHGVWSPGGGYVIYNNSNQSGTWQMFVVPIDANYPFPGQPWLRYNFSQTSGSIANDTAGDVNGTLINFPTDSSQWVGGSLVFDGSNDYVDISDNALPIRDFHNRTITCRVKLNATPSADTFIFGTSSTYRCYITVNASGNLRATLASSGGFGSATLTVGTWYNIALVIRDVAGGNTRGELYVNGILSGISTVQNRHSGNLVGTNIGSYNNGTSGFGNITLDDFRIYPEALPGERIKYLHSEPLMRYDFSESSGSTANDIAGNVNGTLVNFPTDSSQWVGGTLVFDGINDYVDISDSAFPVRDFHNRTITFWVKPNVTPSAAAFIFGTSSAYKCYITIDSNRKLQGTLGSGGPFGNSILTVGKWYHVALVVRDVSGGKARGELYVNGVLSGTSTDQNRHSGNLEKVNIGSYREGTSGWANIALDNFHINTEALSPGRILTLSKQTK